MKNLNNSLTVYISKSLLIEESRLRPIREHLIGLGYNVTEYNPQHLYSDKLLRNADFVLFVPYENGVVSNFVSSKHEVFTPVGKGQYSEAELVHKLNKPAFMFHHFYEGEIKASKISNDGMSKVLPKTIDTNDWKRKFGNIHSYFLGEPLTLSYFLEGMFGIPEYYPGPRRSAMLTPEEVYLKNYQLLLLLS